MKLRVVFDTNIALSALLFRDGRLAWLRRHWARQESLPLVSSETVSELLRALGYPKFKLDEEQVEALLGDYLPYVETVPVQRPKDFPECRDPDDQKFVDLACSGRADLLANGDRDLLAMAATVTFEIETAERYRKRF